MANIREIAVAAMLVFGTLGIACTSVVLMTAEVEAKVRWN